MDRRRNARNDAERLASWRMTQAPARAQQRERGDLRSVDADTTSGRCSRTDRLRIVARAERDARRRHRATAARWVSSTGWRIFSSRERTGGHEGDRRIGRQCGEPVRLGEHEIVFNSAKVGPGRRRPGHPRRSMSWPCLSQRALTTTRWPVSTARGLSTDGSERRGRVREGTRTRVAHRTPRAQIHLPRNLASATCTMAS